MKDWLGIDQMEQAPLEDIKAPEIFIFPVPPTVYISNPHQLTEYYESEIDKAVLVRDRLAPLYNNFVTAYPCSEKWIKYAMFYERLGFPYSSRAVFRRAVASYGKQVPWRLINAFKKFEERQKMIHNAYWSYATLKETFGSPRDRSEIETAVFWRMKFEYACRIHHNRTEHNAWIEYINLLKIEGLSQEDLRGLYQEAISYSPLRPLKRYWVDYVKLWIAYAQAEEKVGNINSSSEIYANCLNYIPHNHFTFSEVWLLYVELEMRRGNLKVANTFLRKSLQVCPRKIIQRDEVPSDVQSVELYNCRQLFEKYLELEPNDCSIRETYEMWKTQAHVTDERKL